MMTHDTYAAIDIGSNAFRLLIDYVEHVPGDGGGGGVEFRKAAFIRVPVRLGEDVFGSGEIGPEKFARVVEAMEGFAHLIRVFGAKAHRACATSAMREARNGPELVAEIKRRSGIQVEIITGIEEAETLVEAGEELIQGDKSFLFIDVGGGSVEASVFDRGRRVFSDSFLLGTVRTLSGGATEAEKERFQETLHRVREKYHPGAIVGSGGNINKIHKMLVKKARGKNDTTLETDDLKKLYHQLSRIDYDQRIEQYGLNDYRADVIVPALEIFLTAARVCRIDEVIVPRIGLADGIIHRLWALDKKK